MNLIKYVTEFSRPTTTTTNGFLALMYVLDVSLRSFE